MLIVVIRVAPVIIYSCNQTHSIEFFLMLSSVNERLEIILWKQNLRFCIFHCVFNFSVD